MATQALQQVRLIKTMLVKFALQEHIVKQDKIFQKLANRVTFLLKDQLNVLNAQKVRCVLEALQRHKIAQKVILQST